jgi:seryl-tRNA synthetase
MIDIRLLRNDPISVKQSISRRGESTADLDLIIELDEKYRKTAENRDQLRNEIKELSRKVGDLHKSGKKR